MSYKDLEKKVDSVVDEGQGFFRQHPWTFVVGIAAVVVVVVAIYFFLR